MLQNQPRHGNNSFGKNSGACIFSRDLIAQQFFQLIARGIFVRIDFRLRRPVAAEEIKILAEISDRLFQNRLGAPLAALLRDARVVMRAIQTHAQIRAAFHARLAAPRLAVQCPRFAAVVAMSGQIHLRFVIYDLRLRAEKQSMKTSDSVLREILKPAVIVGALGYFVDVYDLILFAIVRRASLQDLGFSGDQVLAQGLHLLNLQMLGMLLGGIAFGILGDRLGRLTVLFGSILLYSIGNIANGFVHSVEAYGVCRFVAGFGLAGELGASITLVSEVLSKKTRGYGTMLVAAVGVFGAVIAGLVADQVKWQTAYFIGGGLGLILLVLRVSVAESGMFKQIKKSSDKVSRGNFLCLFTSWKRFLKYLRCILIGLPNWFAIGILITLSPEIATALEIKGEINAAHAIVFAYTGITLGGFVSGFFSQQLRSRKKIVFAFILFTFAAMVAYFLAVGQPAATFYFIVLVLGVGVGYWAVFVAIAAEQFGTNIRATVATTVPNFIRGSVVLLNCAFNFLKSHNIGGVPIGIVNSAAIVGTVCILIALWALRGLDETHGKDLDYIEPI